MSEKHDSLNDIAIIGMHARVPGANNVDEFWELLRTGTESTRFFGSEPQPLGPGMSYVKAAPILEGVEMFDAALFGVNPREAATMDPQLRLFLECAWTALEDAGCDPKQFEGRIGVFGGSQPSSYLTMNLARNSEIMANGGGGPTTLVLLNDRDSLTTLVSYKLDLTGPSVTVQTFCSTSLVAVHLACQSLLNGESDVALAGGVTVNLAVRHGYIYLEGGMLSPDGHTRSFDERANGTVFGNGVGIVVLKRLNDALADGDCIHAVLRGTAINNDGSQKGGYTAPSVIGQSKAIAEAMAIAQVSPESIGYIEAHGTATSIGDPIEIEALTRAFRGGTDKKGFCAIGSVKTNFGHLDRAAGVISLIKTVLALKHAQLPPSLHFEKPNPRIDFENSPFRVNVELREWPRNGTPRRAGVSALGVGGTNAHAIVEEAPERRPADPARPSQLLVVSARTESALRQASERLAAHLESHPDLPLADVAFTLKTGRRRFEHRRALVCGSTAEAIATLRAPAGPRVSTAHSQATSRPVVFMFSGQGAQYVNMTRGLYEQDPTYRRHLDECFKRLRPHLGLDLKELLFRDDDRDPSAAERLNQTAITQPALFAVEYALARLWMSCGIRPQAMIGHSVGEYVAAHLAGVFSLDDALALVAERGRLMQSMEPGAMLAVGLPAGEMPALPSEISLAAVNAPSLCVVSGPTAAIGALQEQFQQRDVSCTPLHTSHAFHSAMMDPMLARFAERLRAVKLAAPSMPYISNLTGTWIRAEQATDPAYWTAHLRETVRFSGGVETLWEEPERILLEIGPGTTLTALARQHAKPGADHVAVPSGRHPRDPQADQVVLLSALGRLWSAGAEVKWAEFYGTEHRHRVSLPTYPFEREKYWIEPTAQTGAKPRVTGKNPDISGWFYAPGWQSSLPPQLFDVQPAGSSGTWIVFTDRTAWGRRLVERLSAAGHDIVRVEKGAAFSGNPKDGYAIDPQSAEDYEALLSDVESRGKDISRIVHAWAVEPVRLEELTAERCSEAQNTRFYSLLHLAKAIASGRRERAVQLKIVCSAASEVLEGEPLCPENAPLVALGKVIPQEEEGIVCSTIDIDAPDSGSWNDPARFDQLATELATDGPGSIVAYRRGQRWIQTFAAVRLPAPTGATARLRERGVYLIVGGLGGVGFALASYLAKAVRARLMLTGRSMLPPRGNWKVWLDSRGTTDTTSVKILRVRKLEELGAEVLVASADAADEGAMEAAMRQAESRFGRIDGVIYAAGIVGGETFRMIQDLDRNACEQQFHPKLTGLLSLDRLLRTRTVDFCLLTSSLSAVLGGLGYGAYAAANAFMDAFARYRNQRREPNWISVNWDEWRLAESADSKEARGLAQFALTPLEGGEAFGRVLSVRGAAELVVSTGDLHARIDQWIKLEGLRESAAAASERKPVATRYPRPNLQNAYLAPGNPTEQKVAEIWQDLLGIEQVGIHDNFFELGGHSMLGIQLVARIKTQLNANVSIATLFEGPTVHSLSGIIAQSESGDEPSFDASRDRGQRRKERSRERSQKQNVAREAVAGPGGVAELI